MLMSVSAAALLLTSAFMSPPPPPPPVPGAPGWEISSTGSRHFPQPANLLPGSSSAALRNADCSTGNPGCLQTPLNREAVPFLPNENPGSNARTPKCGAGAPPGCIFIPTPVPRPAGITTVTDLSHTQYILTKQGFPVEGNHSSSFGIGIEAGGGGDADTLTYRNDNPRDPSCGKNCNNPYIPSGTQSVGGAARRWGDINGDGSMDAIEGWSTPFGNPFWWQSSGCAYGLRLLVNHNRITPSTGQVGKAHFTSTYINEGEEPDVACMRYAAPVLGDVNGDGHTDFVAFQRRDGNISLGSEMSPTYIPAEQMRFPKSTLYLGDGAGGFTRDARFEGLDVLDVSNRTCASSACYGLYKGGMLVDADGDGDLDLLAFPHSDSDGWLLLANDGLGAFSSTALPQPTHITTSGCGALVVDANGHILGANMADMNNDGAIDLVCVAKIYLNDGSGAFGEDTGNAFTGADSDSSVVALGDLDADGDVDVILNGASRNQVWLNDGSGGMVLADPHPISASSSGTRLVIADVDNDGDLDAVEGSSSLWLNDGAGGFSFQRTTVGSTWSARTRGTDTIDGGGLFVDLNGDGDLDMVDGDTVYENMLGGTFVDNSDAQEFLNMHTPQTVHAADVDMDGDIDLIFSVYRDVGTGQEWHSHRQVSRDPTFQATHCPWIPAGDDSECLRARTYTIKPECQATYNMSTVAFDHRADALGYWRNCIEFTDTDAQDGADLSMYGNHIFLNDGTGQFTRQRGSAFEEISKRCRTLSFAVGDIDGDGDNDIIFSKVYISAVGTGMGALHILKNDGTGNFTDTQAGLTGDTELQIRAQNAKKIILGDVDGDGARGARSPLMPLRVRRRPGSHPLPWRWWWW